MFEILEQRRLFTVLVDVHLSGSTLVVNGSSGADLIYVAQNNSGQLAVVAPYGISFIQHGGPVYVPLVATFSPASVSAINIDLKGGNDILIKTTALVPATTARGGSGNDSIAGYFGGTDGVGVPTFAHVYGDGGDDTLQIAGPFCYADGGSGSDTFRNYANTTGPIVDYSARSADLAVDMNIAGGDGEPGENDSVEPSCLGIRGGSGDDLLIGASTVAGTITSGEGMFWGNDGNDTVFGGVGFDQIYGGDGNDELHGGPVGDGPDIGDHIFGDAGNDTLYGTGSDLDFLDGGTGTNTVYP
jgi:Ca2+-binding RTX toxin-like protein